MLVRPFGLELPSPNRSFTTEVPVRRLIFATVLVLSALWFASSTPVSTAAADPAFVGAWSSRVPWPYVGVRAPS